MRFGRKSKDAPGDDVEVTAEAESVPGSSGPRDFEELGADGDGVERVDLGSLLIAPEKDRELRLQVDEKSGTVQSVMLAGPDGALELRAFAAPRNGDLWAEVRPQIAADLAQRGGTATEREGRFGVELVCQSQVRRPEGTVSQPSRILGINGPRWLLRATLLGKPAVDVENSAEWEDLLDRVVVRRGVEAKPVGEALPLVLPAEARRVSPK